MLGFNKPTRIGHFLPCTLLCTIRASNENVQQHTRTCQTSLKTFDKNAKKTFFFPPSPRGRMQKLSIAKGLSQQYPNRSLN